MSDGPVVPRFDLRLLVPFVVVAEELHFGRAAERLHLAQPSLSRQVARLEEQLDAQLLVRSSRAVELTPAGERFLVEARDVVARSALAQEQLRDDPGELRVDLGEAGSPLVRHVMASFCNAHPRVRVRLDESSAFAAVARVAAGEVDLAVDNGYAVPPGCRFLAVDPAPFGLVCSVGHRLAAREVLAWSDLDGERLVLAPPGVADSYNERVSAVLRRRAVDWRRADPPASEKARFIAVFLAGGQASLLVPRFVFDPLPEGLAWIPIEPVEVNELGLVWNPETTGEATPLLVAWAEKLARDSARPLDAALRAVGE